ncbi:MAG: zinc-binding dehydrogenase [Candidatus Methylomirabilis sp.]|nr:zinc-binding dehydrogenase [Deltaproteobacteria bacterium]
MRQVWIPKIGGPDVLEVREAPDPTPQAGQVRIRTAGAGLNFADVMARMGLYPDAPKLPTVVGYEVSGEVDAVGAGVQHFKAGDRVVALTRFGGHSDVVCVAENQAFHLPGNLETRDGAAVPVNYLTAWLMLVRLGNVQPGERVLVHAAAGGVGLAALQICKLRGAEVIGTASGGKHARLKDEGVAHCIDYTREDFEQAVMSYTKGRGVDIVLDAVGGESLKKGYRCLAPLGRLFIFGASSFAPEKKRSLVAAVKGILSSPIFLPMPLMDKNRGVFGVNLGHLWDHTEMLGASMKEILSHFESGEFTAMVDKAFPFAEAAKAHEYIQDRKNFGKVLLVP